MSTSFVVFDPCSINPEEVLDLMDRYPITREEAVYLIEDTGYKNISDNNICLLMINKIGTESSMNGACRFF